MAEEIFDESQRKAFLVDLTRCIGCRSCQVACEEWHDDRLAGEGETLELNMPWGGRAKEEPAWSGGLENPTSLTPRSLCYVHFMEPEEGGPETMGGVAMRFQRAACNHCRDAVCKEVCPVPECITHDPDSGYLVVLDPAKCAGCASCVSACPFGVPQFDPATKKAYKCNGCHERATLAEPPVPLCVQACPTGALQFGMRSFCGEGDGASSQTMEAELERRFNSTHNRELKPVRYGHGKDENAPLGGLGVMYVLEDMSSAYASLPTTPTRPGAIAAARGLWANLAWVLSAGAVVFMLFHALAFGRLGEKVQLSEEEETYLPTDEELEQEFKQKRLEGREKALKPKFTKRKKIKRPIRPPKGRKIE
jgi:formate dehydrogenase iron-sulfur subunit